MSDRCDSNLRWNIAKVKIVSWFSVNLVSWPSISSSIKRSVGSFEATFKWLFLSDKCQLQIFRKGVGGLMNGFLKIEFSVPSSLEFKLMGNVSIQGFSSTLFL